MKQASQTWGLLKPNGRPLSFLAATRLTRLGCDTVACGARLLGTALNLEGKLPAVERNGELLVREALCPSPDDAVKVKRHTAWCRRGGQECPHLDDEGDGWVACARLGTGDEGTGDEREAFDPAIVDIALTPQEKKGGYWWDLDTSKKQESKPSSKLSDLLKMVAPAALAGLAIWRAKEKQIAMLRRTPGTGDRQYKMVRSVLKAYKKAHTYNTDTRTFKMGRASIELQSNGGALFTAKNGRKTRVKKGKVLDFLFEFAGDL